MVVDSRTSLREISKDIANQMMVLHHVSTLLLLVGRADILNNEDMLWVLDGLIQAVNKVEYKGAVVVAGPLPTASDQPWLCKEMKQHRRSFKKFLQEVPNVHFCDAGDVLFDEKGVIQQLLDWNGLTLDGKRELSAELQKCEKFRA